MINAVSEVFQATDGASHIIKSLCAIGGFVKLGKRISEYLNGKYNLENFTLTGLTFTTDINVGSRDKVSDYIKILQRIGKVKCFSPFQY